ncbi:MAG TPA: 1-deoxy-D-xylulose-5-phosphate reductoisomerase [Treponemataceae bacterium]|nr:1-deoxy-D-xylulose-5-phosphate reductoisomerase [Treponemataceae bacterium]
MKKKVLVLGCTGSIGTSTLDIIRSFPDLFEVAGLSAFTRKEELIQLSKEFGCTNIYHPNSTKNIEEFIQQTKADIAVNGISGAAGLLPTVSALKSGMDVALANKETIVTAGNLILDLAKKNNKNILPVDSEHSAIFSLIENFGRDAVETIILTASGGPFKHMESHLLSGVKPQDALKHPTWNMGKKITIDSATLANKGLEVIEASILFNKSGDQIKVAVHPESIVHSLIQTKDGIIYAQLSPPDMKHPILTALTYPSYLNNMLEKLDFSRQFSLSFLPPRYDDFPMLNLAYETIKSGGSYTIAYNAANEVAVEAFLQEKILFTDIASITKNVLDRDWSMVCKDFSDVSEIDSLARKTAGDIF